MSKVFAAVLLVSLSLSAFTGCRPSFQGTTANRDGNGLGPSAPAGQPQVTSLSPGAAPAGGASFTMTVNGLNFVPSTTVFWDTTTSLTTTYVSSTVLQAQVPASLIVKPGTSVVIPSPVVSLNFGANFTITVPPLVGNNSFAVSMIPVQANDLAWNNVNQQFYLAMASGNGTNGNTITALNPQTGVLGSSVSTGSEPGKLSISSDSTYIYAGLNNAGSVQRYTLPALKPELNIPLGSNPYGLYYAIDLQAEPGSPHSVAISRGVRGYSPTEQGGVLIYDDAVARPQSVPGAGSGTAPIDVLVWNSNGQSLYGIDTETNSGLYVMAVNSAGVQIQPQRTATQLSLGSNAHFNAITGYLYSDTGKVIDPATTTVVATFPLNAVQGGFNVTPIMVTDSQLNIAYFLGQTNYGFNQGSYVLEAFDLTHFTLLGAIPITNVVGIPSKIIRWGSNGLAFLTGNSYGAGAAGDGVYLVSGGFVTSPAP